MISVVLDSGLQPVDRVSHQRLDATGLAQLAINRERGNPVYDCPVQPSHHHGVVAPHKRVALQRGEGVHERLERIVNIVRYSYVDNDNM